MTRGGNSKLETHACLDVCGSFAKNCVRPKIGGKNPEKVFTFILFCFGFVVVVRRMIIN